MTHDEYIDALIGCYESGEPSDKLRRRWDLHCTVTTTAGGWRFDPWEVRGEEGEQRARAMERLEDAFASEPRWRVGAPVSVTEKACGPGDSGRHGDDSLAEMMRRQSEATARAVDGLAARLARDIKPILRSLDEAFG